MLDFALTACVDRGRGSSRDRAHLPLRDARCLQNSARNGVGVRAAIITVLILAERSSVVVQKFALFSERVLPANF